MQASCLSTFVFMNSTHTAIRALAIVASCSVTLAASADLVAYDGFNYGGGPNLHLANGGTGWSSKWFNIGAIPTGVILDGLTWPNLQTSGGSALTAPYQSADYTRYSRAIAAYTAPEGTLYLSFLFRPNIGFGMGGGLAFGTWENGVIVGAHPGTYTYGLSNLQGVGTDSEVPMVLDQTALVVARVHDNNDGTITWSLFMNPAVGQAEPQAPDATMTIAGTALPQATFIYNDGGFSTDEIRFATTWASVLPAIAAPCTADLDGNGQVNGADLGMLLGNWGSPGQGDLDGNGMVDGADLGALLGSWGACP